MKNLKAILASAALVFAAQAAHSAEAVSVGYTQLSETVRYADLDVNKPAGADALYKRLNRAAKNVCAPLKVKDLARGAQHRSCVNEALANAVAYVNQPLLTEHHRSRGAYSATAIVAKR